MKGSVMSNPVNPSSRTTISRPASVSSSSTVSTADPKSNPKQPRQRLRPWLIDQINSGEVPGLAWVDKGTLSFKVPWKHFGRPGINEYEDALLFRRWALHTSKFREGEKPDISTWKTRFRCALHKLPDVEELHEYNQKEGDEPFRVYRFKKKEIEVEAGPCRTPPPQDMTTLFSINNSTADSTANTPMSAVSIGSPAPDSPASILKSENPSLWMSPESSRDMDLVSNIANGEEILDGMDFFSELDFDNDNLDNALVNDIMDIQNGMLFSMENTPSQDSEASFPNTMDQTMETLASLQNSPQHHSALSVKLYNADKEVMSQTVDNPHGLRVAFNPPRPLPNEVLQEDAAQFYSNIFGPFRADQIYFPPVEDKSTKSILECLRRGLVIQARNGQILATRLCRAKVFYSDTVANSKTELPREQTVVVFDYSREFYPKFREHILGNGPAPSYERYFSFAEKWSTNAPLVNKHVRVTLSFCLAQQQLAQFQKQNAEYHFSGQDIFDIIAQQIEGLDLQGS